MLEWGDVSAAARTLGLVLRNSVAEGVLEGRRLSISVEWTTRQPQVFVRCKLDPPLDLGLSMSRREVTLLGSNDFSTGSDDLDTEFAIGADEPARAAGLFTDALSRQLAALHRTPYDMIVDDAGVALTQQYGFGTDEPWMVRAAHAAVETVELMDAARAGVAPALPITRHAASLTVFARARGLVATSAPFSVGGKLDGRPIDIVSVRTGRGRHHLAARAPFELELGLGLAIRREGIFDAIRSMLGGQDIQVGDAPFDKRFLVRADPPRAGRVGTVLDHDARALLLDIDQRGGPVSIDDRGISVEPIVPHSIAPETSAWLLEALDEARARVDRNLVHGEAGGPYR